MNPDCNNEARIKFCSNKCKDRYHNLTNPRGMYSYLKYTNPDHIRDEDFDPDDWEHPFSDEALGQN